MNALHPLAVYAAVQAHKKEPLHYPGDIEAWYFPQPWLFDESADVSQEWLAGA